MEDFLESIRGLIGFKIGLFLLNNQFTEGTLIDVSNDHVVVQVNNEDVFYFALDQIKAISRDSKAKKSEIDLSALNPELAESLDEILNELKYNWVTINNFNNQIFSGVLSKIANDYVILADHHIHFFIQKVHIASVYKGEYESQDENTEENDNNNDSNENSEDANSNEATTDNEVASEEQEVQIEAQEVSEELEVQVESQEASEELEVQVSQDISDEISTDDTEVVENSEENAQEIQQFNSEMASVLDTNTNTNPQQNTISGENILNHLYTFTSLKHTDPLGSSNRATTKNSAKCKRKKIKPGLQSYNSIRNTRDISTLNTSTSEVEEMQESIQLETTLSPGITLEDQNKLIESQYYSLMNFAEKMANSQSQFLSLKRHAEKMHSQLKDERLINN